MGVEDEVGEEGRGLHVYNQQAAMINESSPHRQGNSHRQHKTQDTRLKTQDTPHTTQTSPSARDRINPNSQQTAMPDPPPARSGLYANLLEPSTSTTASISRAPVVFAAAAGANSSKDGDSASAAAAGTGAGGGGVGSGQRKLNSGMCVCAFHNYYSKHHGEDNISRMEEERELIDRIPTD